MRNKLMVVDAACRRIALCLQRSDYSDAKLALDEVSEYIKSQESGDLDLIDLESAGVTRQTANALRNASLYTIGDLAEATEQELQSVPHLDKGRIKTIKKCLEYCKP